MFPFQLNAPNYVVYKSCGSYLPLRQDLEQSPLLALSLSSLIPVFRLCRFSLSQSLASAWCVFSLVCLCCSVCLLSFVSPLGVFLLSLASPLTLQHSNYHQLTNPPTPTSFKRTLVSIAVPSQLVFLSLIHRLWDSGVVIHSLG